MPRTQYTPAATDETCVVTGDEVVEEIRTQAQAIGSGSASVQTYEELARLVLLARLLLPRLEYRAPSRPGSFEIGTRETNNYASNGSEALERGFGWADYPDQNQAIVYAVLAAIQILQQENVSAEDSVAADQHLAIAQQGQIRVLKSLSASLRGARRVDGTGQEQNTNREAMITEFFDGLVIGNDALSDAEGSSDMRALGSSMQTLLRDYARRWPAYNRTITGIQINAIASIVSHRLQGETITENHPDPSQPRERLERLRDLIIEEGITLRSRILTPQSRRRGSGSVHLWVAGDRSNSGHGSDNGEVSAEAQTVVRIEDLLPDQAHVWRALNRQESTSNTDGLLRRLNVANGQSNQELNGRPQGTLAQNSSSSNHEDEDSHHTSPIQPTPIEIATSSSLAVSPASSTGATSGSAHSDGPKDMSTTELSEHMRARLELMRKIQVDIERYDRVREQELEHEQGYSSHLHSPEPEQEYPDLDTQSDTWSGLGPPLSPPRSRQSMTPSPMPSSGYVTPINPRRSRRRTTPTLQREDAISRNNFSGERGLERIASTSRVRALEIQEPHLRFPRVPAALTDQDQPRRPAHEWPDLEEDFLTFPLESASSGLKIALAEEDLQFEENSIDEEMSRFRYTLVFRDGDQAMDYRIK